MASEKQSDRVRKMTDNEIGVAIMLVAAAVCFFSYGYDFGKTVTLRHCEQHYWRVRADADAKKNNT